MCLKFIHRLIVLGILSLHLQIPRQLLNTWLLRVVVAQLLVVLALAVIERQVDWLLLQVLHTL
jgi:hypothetical protein